MNGTQAGDGPQGAWPSFPGCAHAQHGYIVKADVLEPAVYDGADRSQALSALVAIRQAARQDPDTYRIGFAVVRLPGPDPARQCLAEQRSVAREAWQTAPVPPRPSQGKSCFDADHDVAW